jgi:hypothetical protein
VRLAGCVHCAAQRPDRMAEAPAPKATPPQSSRNGSAAPHGGSAGTGAAAAAARLPGPPLVLRRAVRGAEKWLSNLQLAIAELAVLAGLSAVGTVIEQGEVCTMHSASMRCAVRCRAMRCRALAWGASHAWRGSGRPYREEVWASPCVMLTRGT